MAGKWLALRGPFTAGSWQALNGRQMATLKRAICDNKWLAMLPFLPFVALTETTNGPFMSCLLGSNPKVNRGCAPLTANGISADCVQISLGPSIPCIPLEVYHTGGYNAMFLLLTSYFVLWILWGFRKHSFVGMWGVHGGPLWPTAYMVADILAPCVAGASVP